MGCEVRESIGKMEGPDGTHSFRFLYNPESGQVASLSDYEDDEKIPERVVEQWERALELEIPKGDA